tara:strand:- start:2981 stop:3484 length:504 start_codon:yes stop_codon:yes gene_type:complete
MENKLSNIQAALAVPETLKEIQTRLEEIEKMASYIGISDIFRNKKFIEVAAANQLQHKWNDKPYGADAYELVDGIEHPTEYKSARVGGSFQFHWLSENKMAKIRECKHIYFLVTEGVRILEIYTIPTYLIFEDILEKSTNGKSTAGHKSFSLTKLKEMGATKVCVKQ